MGFLKARHFYHKLVPDARLRSLQLPTICMRCQDYSSLRPRLSRYDKAIEYYDQAVAIKREVKDRADEGRTLGNLMLLRQKQNNNRPSNLKSSVGATFSRRNEFGERVAPKGATAAYCAIEARDRSSLWDSQPVALTF
jgi:hypothetical protein